MQIEFDPTRPGVMADPYPIYRRLRAEDPVHWCEALNGWVLTRYDDVRMAQRDARFSADRARPFADQRAREDQPDVARMGELLAKWVVFNDPPRHTVLRRLMLDAFTPRAIEALRGRITEIVDELLDDAVQRPRMDLIGDFAYPLPATVIAHILGVPDKDIDRFRAWSNDVATVVGVSYDVPDRYQRGARALSELTQYFHEVVAERRQRGDKGALIDALINAHDEDGSLSSEELVGNCVVLLFAGHETTTNLIGNGMVLLLERPDQLAKLRANPELMPSAVEEILRYESPAHAVMRIAAEDFSLRGKEIRKGEKIFLMLAAANRDPEQFDEPERFDITRDPNRHLSFGYGLHFCIGAQLARVEGGVAMRRLLERFPSIALDTDELEWDLSLVLRGVHALPLAVKAAA